MTDNMCPNCGTELMKNEDFNFCPYCAIEIPTVNKRRIENSNESLLDKDAKLKKRERKKQQT